MHRRGCHAWTDRRARSDESTRLGNRSTLFADGATKQNGNVEATLKNGQQAALAAITWAVLIGFPAAQTGNPPKENQLNPGSVRPGGGKTVVIGCLSSDGAATSPKFSISESRAKPPVPTYRLEGDADFLRVHVGHTVEIGGPVTPATGTQGNGNAAPTLKVESLAYVSKTCLKYP
jgi:hypothetical protein